MRDKSTAVPPPSPKTLASKEELNEIARALQDLWSVVKPEPRPSPFDAVWREYAAEIRRVVLKNTPPQEQTTGLPQDVINLVIAAREFWDGNNDLSHESRALDKALTAFSERVPYENQPDEDENNG